MKIVSLELINFVIFFNELFKNVKKDGCGLVISGQNADTFYNFGPTTKLGKVNRIKTRLINKILFDGNKIIFTSSLM